MKVRLVFVPPGGGEADHSLDFELPAIPQPGDYISVLRRNHHETEDFIVRRTWWGLERPNDPASGGADSVGRFVQAMVECEFAVGAHSSKAHRESCEAYRARTGKLLTFDASTY